MLAFTGPYWLETPHCRSLLTCDRAQLQCLGVERGRLVEVLRCLLTGTRLVVDGGMAGCGLEDKDEEVVEVVVVLVVVVIVMVVQDCAKLGKRHKRASLFCAFANVLPVRFGGVH